MILAGSKILKSGTRFYESVSTPPFSGLKRFTMPFAMSGGLVYVVSTNTASVPVSDIVSAVFREYLPAGVNGYVRCRGNGLGVGFDDAEPGFKNNLLLTVQKNQNNKVEAAVKIDGNVSYITLVNDGGDVGDFIISFGENVTLAYSIDGGLTWPYTTTVSRIPGMNYYFRINDYFPTDGKYATNLEYLGLVIDPNV